MADEVERELIPAEAMPSVRPEQRKRVADALRSALEKELGAHDGAYPLDWHAKGSVHSKSKKIVLEE